MSGDEVRVAAGYHNGLYLFPFAGEPAVSRQTAYKTFGCLGALGLSLGVGKLYGAVEMVVGIVSFLELFAERLFELLTCQRVVLG